MGSKSAIDAILMSPAGLWSSVLALSAIFVFCLLVLWRRPRGVNGDPVNLIKAANQIITADFTKQWDADNAVKPRIQRQYIRRKFKKVLPGLKLLWVDDQPEKVATERKACELAGWDVVTVKSNEAAVEQMMIDRFDVIISDIGREDPFGPSGLYLFDQLLECEDIIRIPPIIFYSSLELDDIGKPTDNEDEYLVRVDMDLSGSKLMDVVFPGDDNPVFIPSTHRPIVLLDLVLRSIDIDRSNLTGRLSPWYQASQML